MYVPSSNPNQYAASLLNFPSAETLCCGTGAKIIAAKYHTSFLNTDEATIDEIVIDGVIYPFTTARSTTTAAGRAGIRTETMAIMTTLLGTTKGDISVSISGTRVHISTSYSSLKIQSIGTGTNVAFVPTEAVILGNAVNLTQGNFIMHTKLNAAGTYYDVRIKPLFAAASAAVIVDYAGSTDEYNSDWPTPSSYSLPAGTTIVNGYICFSVLKATGDADATLVVTVTPVGGSAITYSQTVKLLNLTNQ